MNKNPVFEETSSSNVKIEKETMFTEPCIPYNETLFKIPQNLPIGTPYNVGLREQHREYSLGEKIDIINSTLNNITEILSYIALRQLPEITSVIQQKLEIIINTLEQKDKGLASQEQVITIAEKLIEIINSKEQIKNFLEIKRSPRTILPPMRLT